MSNSFSIECDNSGSMRDVSIDFETFPKAVHEMATLAFEQKGFENRGQHIVYIEAANALRRYQAVFPEIVPKKIPKTYGPPRIGKRGKICKW